MTIFGMTIPTPVFWVIVAVIIVALVCVIAVPVYQGYKKEMAKTSKKAGSASKKPSGSSKSSGSRSSSGKKR